jgi:hypothetical protein
LTANPIATAIFEVVESGATSVPPSSEKNFVTSTSLYPRQRMRCSLNAINVPVSKETSYSVKRDLSRYNAINVPVSKETSYSVKRDL